MMHDRPNQTTIPYKLSMARRKKDMGRRRLYLWLKGNVRVSPTRKDVLRLYALRNGFFPPFPLYGLGQSLQTIILGTSNKQSLLGSRGLLC